MLTESYSQSLLHSMWKMIILILLIHFIILFLSSFFFAGAISLSYYYNLFSGKQYDTKTVLYNVLALFKVYLPIISGLLKVGFITSIYCILKDITLHKLSYNLCIKNIIKQFIVISIVMILFIMYMDYGYESSWFSLINQRKTPVIVAHRAGGIFAPENSLKALESTKKSGISAAVEIDVQLTKDGETILLHDDTFTRVIGINYKPEELTLHEIQGHKTKDIFGQFTGEPIPTLEDFIENSENIKLMIELKGPKNRRIALLDSILNIVQKHSFESNAIIASMSVDDLKYLKIKNPNIETCFISAIFYSNDFSSDYIDIYSIEATFASSSMIKLANNEGKKIYYWTINQLNSVKRILSFDPDGIITDNIYIVDYLINSELEIVPFQNSILNYYIKKRE